MKKRHVCMLAYVYESVFVFLWDTPIGLYVLATAFPTFGHLRDAVLVGLTDGEAAARTPPRD